MFYIFCSFIKTQNKIPFYILGSPFFDTWPCKWISFPNNRLLSPLKSNKNRWLNYIHTNFKIGILH